PLVAAQPVGEERELLGLQLLVAVVELPGEHGHALLEPPALRLELERVRVAVRERALEVRDTRRLLARSRVGGQLVDLLEQLGDGIRGHRGVVPPVDYSRIATRQTRAARPISTVRGDPPLTGVRTLRTMGRMTRRRLPVVVVVVALLVAAPAGAGDSPLAKRLGRALAVPHVSQARTGAVAFDLQTGETLFTEHDALSLAPASNEKLAIAYTALV